MAAAVRKACEVLPGRGLRAGFGRRDPVKRVVAHVAGKTGRRAPRRLDLSRRALNRGLPDRDIGQGQTANARHP